MQKRLNWDEIKKNYPDQWVSIIEPDSSITGILKSGIVVGNGKDKKAVIAEFKEQKRKGINYNIHTFRYTGKIPKIAGLYKLELKATINVFPDL